MSIYIYLYLATIIPLDDAIERDIFDVNIKLSLLMGSNGKDKILGEEYDKMLLEKNTFKFLCYCEEAKVGTKRVSFIAYKLLIDENSKELKDGDHGRGQMENVDDERNSLKRKRGSSATAVDPQNKRSI